MSALKLYLVEDQLLTRQAFARAFSATERYEVVGQSAGAAELLSNPATWQADVIILDLALSRYGSLDAIHQLRERGVRSPILILSSGENGAAMQAILNAGAQGCVPKHSDFNEMEHAIEAVAKGQTYLSPSLQNGSINGSHSGNGANPWPNSSQSILSKREHEIFMLLAQGKKNREIGKLLCISTRTVDTHRSNILKKLQVKSNAELARMAIKEGLL
ncbi:MAG: LuxR C-terminal-related transcriptional regulator [Pseudomonadota bacterium]|jgi:DNA-binding NarL/FixJ family response regulator